MDSIFRRIILLQYGFYRFLIHIFQRLLFRSVKTNVSYSNILVVRKGSLGDMICAMPAFHAIKKRFPGTRLTLLTTHGSNDPLHFNRMFGNIIFDKVVSTRDHLSGSRLFAKVRQERFDLVIELPQNMDTLYTQLRNMIWFRLAGIHAGFGWAVTNTLFLRKKQNRLLVFKNEQERISEILGDNNFPVEETVYFPEDKESDRKLEDLFREKGFADKNKNVAISFGAKLERQKWPLVHFREVIDRLLGRGYHIVLIGDEGDAKVSSFFHRDGVIDLCGKLSVKESAAAMRRCFITISNDSGPMHLSYASGTPVIGIFSARNYRGKWTPPQNGLNAVLRHDHVDCIICRNRPCTNNICMTSISPDEVIRVFDDLNKQK